MQGVRSDDTKTDVSEEVLPRKLSYKIKLGVGLCPMHFSINWASPDFPRENP